MCGSKAKAKIKQLFFWNYIWLKISWKENNSAILLDSNLYSLVISLSIIYK